MTTTIKRDCHGVYVRTNAVVYRPQPAKHSYTLLHAANGTSQFIEGQAVAARAVAQSPFCRVQDGKGNKEIWHGHGQYIAPNRASDQCWNPK